MKGGDYYGFSSSSAFWSAEDFSAPQALGTSAANWLSDVIMRCDNPYISGGAAYGCGQCRPCRINRRRLWTRRMMLERLCHREACFLGLSYHDLRLPLTTDGIGLLATGMGLPTLRPKDLQDWLKRLRKAISPLKVRYYGVGEYGDKTYRPHYHVVLYGYPQCVRGVTLGYPYKSRWRECCVHCRLLGETWGMGDIVSGSVTNDSCSYCAGYTVKKMTALDDTRLFGRHPEFARMSLRPGIGADAMFDVASELMKHGLDESMVDVPSTLRSGPKIGPIGRYLKGKLREYVGREAGTPQEVLDEWLS